MRDREIEPQHSRMCWGFIFTPLHSIRLAALAFHGEDIMSLPTQTESVMGSVEFVSFEDCFNIPVGSEDEVIDRIDAERNERDYENDATTGNESLIEAVHVARRFFV